VKNNQKLVDELVSDYELLLTMSWHDEPGMEDESKNAYGKFYERHKEFLMKVCKRACRSEDQANDELAEDLFFNTMKLVYDKARIMADGIEHKQEGGAEKMENRVEGYLSVMADNMLKQMHKAQKRKIKLELPEEEAFEAILGRYVEQEDEAKAELSLKSAELLAVEQALELLSERERDILLTYMRYENGNMHLPDEEIAFLCERYNLKAVTLRVIKKRALEKVTNKAKGLLKI